MGGIKRGCLDTEKAKWYSIDVYNTQGSIYVCEATYNTLMYMYTVVCKNVCDTLVPTQTNHKVSQIAHAITIQRPCIKCP